MLTRKSWNLRLREILAIRETLSAGPRRFNASKTPPIGQIAVILVTSLVVQGFSFSTSFGQSDSRNPTQPIARGSGIGVFGGIVPGGQYPSPEYYSGLQLYRDGEIDRAVEIFDSSLGGSRLDVRGRWIDAIPSLAMLGECYWHLGDLREAKRHHDKVLEILFKHRGWLARTDWSSVQQNSIRQTPTWLWPKARSVQVIAISDRVPFRAGDRITEQRLRQGGVIEEQSIRQIDLVEVMRGVSIACFRRRLIMGELSSEDQASQVAIEKTKYPANLRVPIGRSLIGAMRTAGYFTNADKKRVIEESNKNAFFGGRAHPLTPITMLTRAWSTTGEATPSETSELTTQIASVSAALRQPEWIGEAMQLAAGSADDQNASEVAKTASQIAAVYLNRSRLTALHCLIAAADAAVTAGDIEQARQYLKQAKIISSRRDVILPRLQTYGAYVNARLAVHSGATIGLHNSTDADVALKQVRSFALELRRRRSKLISIPKLYQIAEIRSSFGSDWGGRSGDVILAKYTRNATAADWQRDPVDALGMMMADRSNVFQARLELAASQNYADALLARANEMLTNRFLQRLPMGGRLCNLRTLSQRPDDFLPQEVIAKREAAGKAMAELLGMVAREKPSENAVLAMENKASQIALSRLEMPQIALPTISRDGAIDELPKGTGLLMFITINNDVHGILGSDRKLTSWKIPNAKRLASEVGRLLKAIGVGKGRGKRIPEDDSWKKLAMGIRNRLLPDSKTITAERFDRLLIVPDGSLWYLPFEILPIGEEDGAMMHQSVTIKYAPTPGVALSNVGAPAIHPSIGFAGTQFLNPRDPADDADMIQSVTEGIEHLVQLPKDLENSTAWLGDHVGHFVAAQIIPANLKNPLAMPLAAYDAALPSGQLYGWIRYPARAPASVVMMGTRTPVGVGQMGDGNEIFQTLAALHVAGTRDVLMSRWAVGGESSATLLRELMQELPFEGLDGSWKRARQVLKETPLDPTREPLLSKSEAERGDLTGEQPLFWAGYLVSGTQ